MFEKWVEKFLFKVLGQFIEVDISKIKFGFSSSDVIAREIALKPKLFQNLGLPIKIRFSVINKLSVNVPWKLFKQKPVIISLEDVYVVIEPAIEERFQIQESRYISKKLKFVNYVTKQFSKRIHGKQKDKNKKDKQDKATRLLDNLQITLKNLHLRYEDPINKYAWGLVLDELLVSSVRKIPLKEPIDQSSHSGEPLKKIISVRNLGVYCSLGTSSQIGRQDPDYMKQTMKSFFQRSPVIQLNPIEYIVVVSGFCEISKKPSNESEGSGEPVHMAIRTEVLDFKLKKYQLEGLINLMATVNKMTVNSSFVERKSEILTLYEKELQKQDFKRLFAKVIKHRDHRQLNGMKQAKEALSKEMDIVRFKELLLILSPQDLALIVKGVITSLEEAKHRKRNLCFKYLGLKSKHEAQPVVIDGEDFKIIEEGCEQTLNIKRNHPNTEKRLKNILYLSLMVVEGSLYLCRDVNSSREGGIILSYQGVELQVNVTSKEEKVDLLIKNLGISLRTPDQEEISVLSKLANVQEIFKGMICLQIQNQLEGADRKYLILCDVQGLELIYGNALTESLIDFLSVLPKREIPHKALSQVEIIEQQMDVTRSAYDTKINKRSEILVRTNSIVVTIPFPEANGDEVQEEGCIVYLGALILNIKSPDLQNIESKLNYNVDLRNLEAYYFPSKNIYTQILNKFMNRAYDIEQTSQWEIINQPNISVDILIDRKKGPLRGSRNESQITVNVSIEVFCLLFKSEIYGGLLKVVPLLDKLLKLLIHAQCVKTYKKKWKITLTTSLSITSMTLMMRSSAKKEGNNMVIFQSSLVFDCMIPRLPNIMRTLKLIRLKSVAKLTHPDTEQVPHHQIDRKINVKLGDAELFICNFTEHSNNNGSSKTYRRPIILPFSLNLSENTNTSHDHKKGSSLSLSRILVILQSLVVKFSYKDLLFLYDSVRFQTRGFKKGMDESMEKIKPKRIPKKRVSEPNQTGDLKECRLQSNGIQIILIDDADEIRAPFLKLKIVDLLLEGAQLGSQMKLGGNLFITSVYFNPLPYRWEPFIEGSGFEFGLSVQHKSKVVVNVKNKKDTDTINLNISDHMVSVLYPITMNILKETQKYFQLGSDRKEIPMNSREDSFIQGTASTVIVNNTGCNVQVDTDFMYILQNPDTGKQQVDVLTESYVLKNLQSKPCFLEPDNTNVFEKGAQDPFILIHGIRLKILHPLEEISPINLVDIEKNGIRRYEVESMLSDTKTKSYFMNTIIETEKAQRIITMTSSVCIINKLPDPYRLIFEINERKVETILNVNQTASVPIDFTQKGMLSIAPINSLFTSIKTNIQELVGLNTKTCELQVGPSFITAKTEKLEIETEFYNVFLMVPLEIKNCCGLEMFIKLLGDNEEPYNELKNLKPQESLHQTNISIKQVLYIQIRLQGYKWCQKILVSSDLQNDKIEKIPLEDSIQNSPLLCMFMPKDALGRRKILLYTETCVINETPYELQYAYIENDKKEWRIGQLQRDEQEAYDPRITLTNDIRFIVLSRPSEREFSEPVPVEIAGTTVAEIVNTERPSLLELGVTVTFLKCDRDYNLETKIVTISPRYVFVNKTNYQLEVRQYQGNKSLALLQKDVRTPFYLSQLTSLTQEKRITIRISQVNDNQDSWSWSNDINIQTPGLYTLTIDPSKSQKSQPKLFRATVNLIMPTIFVVIEEIYDEKISQKLNKDQKESNSHNHNLDLTLQLAINKLGISVMSTLTNQKRRQEIIYIFLRNLYLHVLQGAQKRFFEVKLEYLHIDNNASYDTSFPVLWAPAGPINGTGQNLIEITVDQKMSSQVTSFDSIELHFNPSVFMVDNMIRDALRESILGLFEIIDVEDFKKKRKKTIAQHLYHNKETAQLLEDADYFTERSSWMKIELSKAMGQTIFIKKLFLKALSLSITTQLIASDTEEDIYFLLDMVMKNKRKQGTKGPSSFRRALQKISGIDPGNNRAAFLREASSQIGQFLASLNSLPLDLIDISMEDQFAPIKVLGNKIMRKYVAKAGNVILNIMEALGKNTLSRVFKYNKPISSFVENEYKFQVERARMRRMVRLSKDNDYKGIDPEEMSEKTFDLAEGPLGGDRDDLSLILNQSIVERVTGVMSRIFQHRPFTHKSKLLNPSPIRNRVRLPRAFYGKEPYYQSYSDVDAEALWRLYFVQDSKYKQISLISAFEGLDGEENADMQDFYILVISFEAIICFNIKSDSIKWTIEPRDIGEIKNKGNSIIIMNRDHKESVQKIEIKGVDSKKIDLIIQGLKRAARQNY